MARPTNVNVNVKMKAICLAVVLRGCFFHTLFVLYENGAGELVVRAATRGALASIFICGAATKNSTVFLI